MNTGLLIFSQVADIIHRKQFGRCMALHPMPRVSKGMSARGQFLAMAFSMSYLQITSRMEKGSIDSNPLAFIALLTER
jgi:hypothetical protein